MLVESRGRKTGPLMYPGSLSPFIQIVGCIPPAAEPIRLAVDSDCENSSTSSSNTSTSSTQAGGSFPLRLHTMLDDAQEKGFDYVVSWKHNGTAFKVHDPDKFVETVLPRYFNQTRYKSFQRQLNIYGFERISKGANKGLCRHQLFQKGLRNLCTAMKRTKIKEATTAFKLEKAIKIEEDSKSTISDEESDLIDSPEDMSDPFVISGQLLPPLLDDKVEFEGQSFYLIEDQAGMAQGTQEIGLPVPLQANSELVCSQEKPDAALSTELPVVADVKYHKQSFPWKLHYMLDEVEKNGFNDIVSWSSDGRGLKVHRSDRFTSEILPQYFSNGKTKKTKWESFQRQLNLYGFVRVPCGKEKGTYAHEYFLRGQRDLVSNIIRNNKVNKKSKSKS